MKRPFFAVLAAALGTAVFLSGRSEPLVRPPARNDVSAASLPVRVGIPKLDSTLNRVCDLRNRGEVDAAEAYAAGRGLAAADGDVQVVIEGRIFSRDRNAAEIESRLLAEVLSARGGKVQARFRNLIQVVLPAKDLAAWVVDPRVARIRAPRRPVLHKSVSEGVAATGANAWADLPSFHAYPAKIAVLDVGFQGYQDLLGTDLPDTVESKSFRQDQDLEADEPHGAACAEIVYDMDPGAQLFLANFDTDVEQYQAVQWLAGEGVDVVSYSIGWYNAGAGDGTGPLCEIVDYANEQGIDWVCSAGNSGDSHWDGEFTDADADGVHEFAPGDEILSFPVPEGETVGVFLNWKDWGTWTTYNYTGTDQDYDLILWRWNGSAWELIDAATAEQSSGDWPVEELYGYTADRDSVWGISIVRKRADRPMRLELFTIGNYEPIEHVVPSRSLTTPADATNAWTAGASDALTDAFHPYSSQGPTWGGRIKPDFSAPSGVTTTTYGYREFYGTSAAAPHLAGALGLLGGGTNYKSRQIRKILEARAIDLGDPGPDNLFGVGRLNLKK